MSQVASCPDPVPPPVTLPTQAYSPKIGITGAVLCGSVGLGVVLVSLLAVLFVAVGVTGRHAELKEPTRRYLTQALSPQTYELERYKVHTDSKHKFGGVFGTFDFSRRPGVEVTFVSNDKRHHWLLYTDAESRAIFDHLDLDLQARKLAWFKGENVPRFSPVDIEESALWSQFVVEPLDLALTSPEASQNPLAFKARWEEAREKALAACEDAAGRQVRWKTTVTQIKEPAGIHLESSISDALMVTRDAPNELFINSDRDLQFYVLAGKEVPMEVARRLRPGDQLVVEGRIQSVAIEETGRRCRIRIRLEINAVASQQLAAPR